MTTNINNALLHKELNEIKQIWTRANRNEHNQNCWRWHHDCAIARLIATIEQQQAEHQATKLANKQQKLQHTTPTPKTPTPKAKTKTKTKTTTAQTQEQKTRKGKL
jgi:hypothetical protein